MQRLDKPLLGVPRGRSPSGKFRKSRKASSGANVACHFAKLAIFFHRRYGIQCRVGSAGDGEICGLAICPGERYRCRDGECCYSFRQEVIVVFFISANKEGANSPVDYLPLRSGQVSNEPGRNESGANCADFISGKSPCSHEQEMFGINMMPYEFYGWHQSDAILKFIKKAKSIFTDSPIFICE